MAAIPVTKNLVAFNPEYDAATNGVHDVETGHLKVVKSFSTWSKLIAFITSGAFIAGAAVFSVVTLAVVLGAVLGTRAANNGGGELEQVGNITFRIIHINDMHARVEGMTATESGASFSDRAAGNKSDGGWPKIFTATKLLVENTTDPVVFLENGDQHMGTIWHTYYKGREAWEFLNVLCGPKSQGGAGFAACVGGVGNHEFDGKYYQLLEYVRKVNYTMVSANIEDTCGKDAFGPMDAGELGKIVAKYTVVTLPNKFKTKVGIVGYLTPETTQISSPPPCINIPDEVTPVTNAISELKAQGIKIIIALGHSGYAVDQTIAATIKDIDIIVGGHSHTFLWDDARGASPGMSDAGQLTTALGAYPTIVKTNGNVFGVPVVQAFWGSRFMGALDLTFDEQGNLVKYVPNLFILGDDGPYSKATTQFADDPVANSIIDRLGPALDAFRNEIVGKSAITATASRLEVRTTENLVGNMVCDAMIYYMKTVSNFGDVDFCLMNSGGVRAGISSGDVRVADVLSILPFNNVMTVLRLTGRQLYIMAEHGVGRWGAQQGEFPQIARFNLVFDSSRPNACNAVGSPAFCTGTLPAVSRVIRLYDNRTGLLIPNDNSKTFTLVTNDFLGRGGDGYRILTEAQVLLGTGPSLDEAFRVYVQSFGNSGITSFLGERIVNCFTTVSRLCPGFDAYYKIPSITANAVSLTGTKVYIRGVIVADLRASHRGFYLQANAAQHRTPAATSEAIFVDCFPATTSLCTSTAIAEGYEVEMNATISASTDSGVVYPRVLQTDITEVRVLCSNPTISLAPSNLKVCDTVNIRTVAFPLATPIDTTLAKSQGMIVQFSGVANNKFIVTENYALGQYGEVGLSASGSFLKTPTQVYPAGSVSQEYAVNNTRNFIVLDDGSSLTFANPSLYPLGGVADNNAGTLRCGAEIATSVFVGSVVMDRRFGAWRLQPTSLGKSLLPSSFTASPDPRAPPATSSRGLPPSTYSEGYIRILGANVLNYFIDFTDTCSTCRGAANATQFAIQSAKIYEAVKQMRPAILAIQEMQNGNAASDRFVSDLNAYIGNGVNYKHIATGTVGTDVIKAAIVYDASLVVPVGNYAVRDYSNPTAKSRPSVAQAFRIKCSSEIFNIVSNHLKSKGSCTPATDGAQCDSTLGGEGNWALARLEHAKQLRDWIATDPTNSNSTHYILLGDFNSYRHELTISTLVTAGFVDIASRDNVFPYSYQFDAAFGTLDYALASPSMATACNASLEWHINSVEAEVLSYTRLGIASSPFRASDHDPLLVGCQFAAPNLATCTEAPSASPTIATAAPSNAPTAWSAFINEFHADNTGSDVDEGVEIAVLKGVDPASVTVQLINGGVNPTAAYATTSLNSLTKSDTVCAGTANEFDLYWWSVVLQNAGTFADSIALTINGQTIEHISYNAGQTLVGGSSTIVPGDTSVAVPVGGPYAAGLSISRTGNKTPKSFGQFTWQIVNATRGSVNQDQTFSCS